MKNKKTNVIFYKLEDGDILAYFPNVEWDFYGNKASYMHVGQHGPCSPEFVKEQKRATAHEYADLANELSNMVGYYLNIL